MHSTAQFSTVQNSTAAQFPHTQFRLSAFMHRCDTHNATHSTPFKVAIPNIQLDSRTSLLIIHPIPILRLILLAPRFSHKPDHVCRCCFAHTAPSQQPRSERKGQLVIQQTPLLSNISIASGLDHKPSAECSLLYSFCDSRLALPHLVSNLESPSFIQHVGRHRPPKWQPRPHRGRCSHVYAKRCTE